MNVKRAYDLAQTGGKKRPRHPRAPPPPKGPPLGDYLRDWLRGAFDGDAHGLSDKPYLFDFGGW